MSELIRHKILSRLKPEQMVFLATVAKNRPYVRPVTLICNKDRFFFATGSADAKTAQITANPNIELCIYFKDEKNSGYIRFFGTAALVTNEKVRKAIYDETSFMSYYWKDSTDPTYALFQMTWQQADYMEPGEMHTTKIDWS